MGKKKNEYRILAGKTLVKRPLGRQKSRWEDNIKMDLRTLGSGLCSMAGVGFRSVQTSGSAITAIV
jgi:hypothetical protein